VGTSLSVHEGDVDTSEQMTVAAASQVKQRQKRSVEGIGTLNTKLEPNRQFLFGVVPHYSVTRSHRYDLATNVQKILDNAKRLGWERRPSCLLLKISRWVRMSYEDARGELGWSFGGGF
jgi:hypothetical protein